MIACLIKRPLAKLNCNDRDCLVKNLVGHGAEATSAGFIAIAMMAMANANGKEANDTNGKG